MKKLNGSIALNFKKIRVSDTKDSKQDKLYNRMRELKEKVDDKSKAELDNVIKENCTNSRRKIPEIYGRVKKYETK